MRLENVGTRIRGVYMALAAALEFARVTQNIKHSDELSNALGSLTERLGFSYFALTHHVDFKTATDKAIRLHNYPQDWQGWFDEQQLGVRDPIHRASQRTAAGFWWRDVKKLISLTAKDEEILARAHSAGIGDGMTVPAHVPGESKGSCSFAMRVNVPVPEGIGPFVQLIGLSAFEAARRLCMGRSNIAHRKNLTDRQRECLIWAARGKTDWEISQILGVSHETVIRHLKQARECYDVPKRTQLTVEALNDGSISFADILLR